MFCLYLLSYPDNLIPLEIVRRFVRKASLLLRRV
jgi:hypothetical protein